MIFLLYRVGFVLAQPPCLFWDGLPAKRQAPVEVTAVVGVIGGNRFVEMKVVEINGGDLWANHCSWLLNNASQERF